MASSYEAFKNLDLSRDEVERLTSALKDKEFRKLFTEYVEELRDPENRKIYQEEITQLEKERGIDVTFVNPVAGYVIKTSVNGSKKCFINVCSNEHVQKPTSSPAEQEGARGLQWSLPHCISPVREDIDNNKIRCDVYDVVFHPDTLHLGQNNKAFRDMVNNTACEAVESNFGIKLDRKNLRFPKMQYKGMPHATVIRRPSKEGPAKYDAHEQNLMDRLYESANHCAPSSPAPKKKAQKHVAEDKSAYTRPNYVIKHRSHIDMQEFTENKDAKINTAIPVELAVEINLPLLKSAADLVLDVNEKSLHLISEKPSKYKLDLTLPYQVNQDAGNAKFDKDLKKLVITLPVKRSKHTFYDSGVESDHGTPVSTSPSSDESPIAEIQSREEEKQCDSVFRTSISKFLDENLHYALPDFSCHIFQNTIAFTLNVKNVSENSIEKLICDNGSSIHIKFASISSGYFPVHYAFFVKLPSNLIDADNLTLEAWDNNVILQFPFIPADNIVTTYFCGLDEENLTQKYIEEPCILSEILKQEDSIEEELPSNAELINVAVAGQTCQQLDQKESKAIDITHTYSESSGDELSCSYSPSKGRGILKSLARRNVSRSISESSLDDVICASSFENCHASYDSVIPEDGEVSTSFKKTVRFNDNVSKQLYRSNSSILGQKKKNQRKARNKKRAHDRRCSESEASEGEEKKERDMKDDLMTENQYKSNEDDKDESDSLFDIDIQ